MGRKGVKPPKPPNAPSQKAKAKAKAAATAAKSFPAAPPLWPMVPRVPPPADMPAPPPAGPEVMPPVPPAGPEVMPAPPPAGAEAAAPAEAEARPEVSAAAAMEVAEDEVSVAAPAMEVVQDEGSDAAPQEKKAPKKNKTQMFQQRLRDCLNKHKDSCIWTEEFEKEMLQTIADGPNRKSPTFKKDRYSRRPAGSGNPNPSHKFSFESHNKKDLIILSGPRKKRSRKTTFTDTRVKVKEEPSEEGRPKQGWLRQRRLSKIKQEACPVADQPDVGALGALADAPEAAVADAVGALADAPEPAGPDAVGALADAPEPAGAEAVGAKRAVDGGRMDDDAQLEPDDHAIAPSPGF